MTQDGLGRLIMGPCVICGLPLVFRYRAKAYLGPLMVSAKTLHSCLYRMTILDGENLLLTWI